MTENEAIEVLQSAISESEKIIAQLSKMKTLAERKNRIGEYYSNIRNCRSEIESCNVAINALKEIQQYREIGTVEECRKAVEKQKEKKPRDIEYDYSYFICPTCGEGIYVSDNFESHKFCLNCGQAIRCLDENLEGMEDE